MSFQWPVTVPILETSDMCKYELDDGKGHRCMVGWRNHTFKIPKKHAYSKFSDLNQAIEQSMKELIPSQYIKMCGHRLSIVNTNDCPKSPKRLLARAWNRAMAYLGYTVGNPEAKYVEGKLMI